MTINLEADFDSAVAKNRCRAYRKRILEMSQSVAALHVAPAYSCLEIVDVIYYELMRFETRTPYDYFIMSKGHGCLSQYVVLNSLGILSDTQLEQYCKPEGILGAHPDRGNPGIIASTGSLGHGLGIATGLAYGQQVLGSDRLVYAVLSDGEMQEGSTWEAIMMAANLKLNNLIVYLDANNFTGLAKISEVHSSLYPYDQKLSSFGWDVANINGHDAAAILHASNSRNKRPLFIVCNTIKGKGVSYMENIPIWHYRSPNPEEYEIAMCELEE